MTVFAPGSVSFRLYPHALGPTDALEEMVTQAALAVDAGFDGVMVSERHGGIVGNVPNPIQVAGWLAGRMAHGWVAPCPVLALLRAPALIVEEIAWLAARFPGRVGVGLGTGGHDLDFRLYGSERDRLAERFEPVLRFVTEHLSGAVTDDELARDHAVALCRDSPVPVLSAAMSGEAARRAARCGAGIIGSSLLTLDRERRLGEIYREAGGAGPEVLIRHVWLGEPPRGAIAAKRDEYRRTSEAAASRYWGADEVIAVATAGELAERLRAALQTTGRTCLHLRVHVPGVEPPAIRDQIARLGTELLPLLRA